MTQKEVLRKALKLHELFHSGKIPRLANHEVNPGLPKHSRINYLYFTLPPCLNFQRSSPAMWVSALKTFKDPKTNYLFYPEKVVEVNYKKLQSDLTKHKLALQKNKHTDIWLAISKAFNSYYKDDPRKLFEQNDWDVVKIQETIQVTQKKDFPYISGPKMANYWLYILSEFTDAIFKNMQEISIIPDTHVLQCSQELGLSKPTDSALQVAAAWKSLLSGSKLTPVEMHPVLWNWSRNNFLPNV